jgi:hypothetical protein
VRDTEGGAQVSGLSSLPAALPLLALALDCNWLLVNASCFEDWNRIALPLIWAWPLSIDLILALFARDLIPDLLRHRRVAICVLPITARLHSLPLRGLLLHRSVAAQLAI